MIVHAAAQPSTPTHILNTHTYTLFPCSTKGHSQEGSWHVGHLCFVGNFLSGKCSAQQCLSMRLMFYLRGWLSELKTPMKQALCMLQQINWVPLLKTHFFQMDMNKFFAPKVKCVITFNEYKSFNCFNRMDTTRCKQTQYP